MDWAKQELEGINLGDKRLNKRAIHLLNKLGGSPSENILSACGSWSETKAAYRFFDHTKVAADRILTSHNTHFYCHHYHDRKSKSILELFLT